MKWIRHLLIARHEPQTVQEIFHLAGVVERDLNNSVLTVRLLHIPVSPFLIDSHSTVASTVKREIEIFVSDGIRSRL